MSRHASASAVMTRWPAQRSSSASRYRAGIASLPLTSRFNWEMPAEHELPHPWDPAAPPPTGNGAFSHFLPLRPTILKRVEGVKRFGAFFVSADKDLR